ncbi:MAG: glutamate racemase [Acidobacteria bacterium]|nr:MAG: glutamate racemase [Acidobacteriota bacterium]
MRLYVNALLYVGDSQFAPYGEKPSQLIRERAIAMTEFLTHQEAKAIVVACNTATGIAVDALRSRFEIPIVAIEPAVKPAASRTRSGVVGVLATTGTVSSSKLAKLVNRHGIDVRFLIQPCPGLADQVEKGEVSSERTRSLVERYVVPLTAQGADVLVLGCTHYPFLRSVIQDVAGPGVEILDPADAVARELRHRLEVGRLLARKGSQGTQRFFTTGARDRASAMMGQLWGSL